MPLHHSEEFYHDLRGRANENLALSTALSIDDAFLQTVVQTEKILMRNATCQTIVLHV